MTKYANDLDQPLIYDPKNKMIVIESDQGAFFDIDETLVMMDNMSPLKDRNFIIADPENNIHACVVVNEAHIQKIKDHFYRGHKVFIWSAGGYKWARAVVKSLSLESYITAIIPKGPWIWDDKEPSEFLKRSYIEFKK